MGPQDWTELVLLLAGAGGSDSDWVALEHDGAQTTIKELADAMCRAAGALSARDGTVAISTADPVLHTVAVLGAVAAGRTALLVDAKQPDALLGDVVRLAGATTVVGRPVPGVELVEADTLRSAAPLVPVPQPPDSIGSIFLTSGSTGLPKLVQRSRGADLHAAMCLRLAGFPIDLGDRHWLSVPYAGAPFLTLLMGALLARATVVIAPFTRSSVDEFLVERRITSAYMVPTMLRLAREHDGLDGPGWRGLTGLMTGGEKLDQPTAEVLLDRFAGRVYCAYGMTESPRLTQGTLEEFIARPGTVGRPIPFRAARIADPGTDDLLPIGAEGEVQVSGPDLFFGYLGQEPSGPWYRTGDLGRLDDDGYLYITGRATSVVKVGGNRVSTDEVAATLRGHDDVAQAAVIAVDDPMWTHRLEGFVVPRLGAVLEEQPLRAWMGGHQPPYKVPRAIHVLDELPLDSSGKLSIQTLTRLATERAEPA